MGMGMGDVAQSAPSEVAETEEACGSPLQNSRPALTHFAAGVGVGGEGGWVYGGGGSEG